MPRPTPHAARSETATEEMVSTPPDDGIAHAVLHALLLS